MKLYSPTPEVTPNVVQGVRAWRWYPRFIRDPLGSIDRARQRYGSVFALAPAPFARSSRKHLIALTPEWNHRVLASPNSFHTVPITMKGALGSAMGRVRVGFESMKGAGSALLRKTLMPLFSKQSVRSYHNTIRSATLEALQEWPMEASVDLAALLHRFSLALSSRLLFGAESTDRTNKLSTLVEEYVLRSYFSWALLFPINFPGFPYARLVSACENLVQFLDQMIQERVTPSEKRDVLDLLLHESPASPTPIDYVGPLTFLFIASFETLATAMTWTLFLLAQHPEIAASVVDELEQRLDGNPPTDSQIEQLPLLDSVISESLRLLPPVPLIGRRASHDLETDGIELRKGDWVFLSQYFSHRDPDLFPEPEKFKPKRWDEAKPTAYEYFPFGAGPRSCIGGTLGMSVLRIALATILQHRRFEVVPKSRIDRVVRVTLNPRQGMPMILHRQDRCFCSVPIRGDLARMVEFPAARTHNGLANIKDFKKEAA